MDSNSNQVKVSRRIPDEERKTIRDYVFTCREYDGKYFRHVSNSDSNGKVYAVEGVRFKKEKMGLHPFILTRKNNNLDLERCLEDIEINLSEFVKDEKNQI